MIKSDEGFYFGLGAFETMVFKDRTPVLVEKHLERLKNTLSFLNIDREITQEEVIHYLSTVPLDTGVVKVAVSPENVDFSFRKNPYTKERYEKGFELCIAPWLRNDTSPFVRHKTLNYLENIWAKRLADSRQFGDTLFVNTKGEICETSSANVFFVKEGQLYTPNKGCGLLPGIFRSILCEGEKVEEVRVGIHHLPKFEECFLTNSVFGIMKVNKIDKYLFPCHELTEKLQKKYRDSF